MRLIFIFLGFCELESSRPRSTSPNLPELEVATITNLVAGEEASASAIQVRIKNNGWIVVEFFLGTILLLRHTGVRLNLSGLVIC